MKNLKCISFTLLIGLFSQCTLIAPDISGYIAILISLLPKSSASQMEYSINVTVTGVSGTGLVLQNNLADDLPIPTNGPYSFSTKKKSNETYSVTILTQPTGPLQTCVVSGGIGTVVSGDINSIIVNCSTSTFTVGGTVTGLAGTGLVLLDVGGLTQSIAANGTFAFATPFNSGAPYTITVQTQPLSPTQTCTITNGGGTVLAANVINVAVNCTTNIYTVGGSVTGIIGTNMVLQNNGGDDLTISADGVFTFVLPVTSGLGYNVTVLTQPSLPAQVCAVSSGSGTVANANITTVSITCTPAYTVGGNVTGLTGTGLILQDSVTGESLPITANGVFTFSTTYSNGGTYNTFIQTQASSQFCVVTSGGSGTVAGANVTSLVLTCYSSGQNISNFINGVTNNHTQILMNGMQYDSSTNSIYMAGVIHGGGNLDGEINSSGPANSSAWISKYDTNGNRLWTRLESAGAGISAQASGLALDAAGNAYITGTVYGAGGNLNGNVFTVANGSFVIKYNSAGVRQWTATKGISRNDGRYVGVDSLGNVYMTGTAQWPSLDGQPNSGWTDDGLTLVKYDSNGNWLATRVLGATAGAQGNMYGYGIAFDSANNIYIAVATTAPSRCSPGPTRTFNGPALIRYDSAMNYLGCTGYSGLASTHSEPFSIVNDTSDNFYITGYTMGSIQGNSLAGAVRNMFVSKLNSAGAILWTNAMGVAGVNTIATSITRSPENFIYVSGYTEGNLDGQTKAGNSDLFVVKYDLNGNKIWTTLVGAPGATAGLWGGGILSDSFNTIFVGGYTNGNAGIVVNPFAPYSAFLISRFVR